MRDPLEGIALPSDQARRVADALDQVHAEQARRARQPDPVKRAAAKAARKARKAQRRH